jgi:hypothetical protein
MKIKTAWHPVAHLGEPKFVNSPVEDLHIFRPDYELSCNLCGYGEIQGNHGIIAVLDGERIYESSEAKEMYAEQEGFDEATF